MLDIDNKDYPDWIHLPRGVKPRSLWNSLHDAEMVSCESDRLNRAVSMKFRVFYLVEDKPDLIYSMKLDEVTSVRAAVSVSWPGGLDRPPADMSSEEWSKLLKEYYAKSREESIGWNSFESSLSGGFFEIHHALLANKPNVSTLMMEGFLKGDGRDGPFCRVFVSFNGLGMNRSDGVDIDFEEFCRLGDVYWDAFAKRRRESDRQRDKSKK